uniref:Reverse transcriptase domain-containing protein n=1 Tax=Lactuca sativa TaxID=4236 RepID=A0A9R1WJE4_LACSA|nr:hypothetical protein LSAT_V11C100030150 [Lactuca sativa]
MLKRKRRKLSISGLMVDGLWVCNPNQIKDHFLRLYKEKIKSFLGAMLSQPSPRLKRLALVHTEKNHSAIWSCGSDRALGPDGFSFRFIKKIWEMLKDDIYNFVDDFFRMV